MHAEDRRNACRKRKISNDIKLLALLALLTENPTAFSFLFLSFFLRNTYPLILPLEKRSPFYREKLVYNEKRVIYLIFLA